MRHGNHGLDFSRVERDYINNNEVQKSFKEKVDALRKYARERLEKEDDLATLVAGYSRSIPDEEMCEKLVKSNEWLRLRVVEASMARALIEEYREMRLG